jgi:hypothetical protein
LDVFHQRKLPKVLSETHVSFVNEAPEPPKLKKAKILDFIRFVQQPEQNPVNLHCTQIFLFFLQNIIYFLKLNLNVPCILQKLNLKDLYK